MMLKTVVKLEFLISAKLLKINIFYYSAMCRSVLGQYKHLYEYGCIMDLVLQSTNSRKLSFYQLICRYLIYSGYQIQHSKERQCLLTILVCFLLIQPKLRHNNNYWLRTSCIFDVRVGHIQVLPGIFPKNNYYLIDLFK